MSLHPDNILKTCPHTFYSTFWCTSVCSVTEEQTTSALTLLCSFLLDSHNLSQTWTSTLSVTIQADIHVIYNFIYSLKLDQQPSNMHSRVKLGDKANWQEKNSFRYLSVCSASLLGCQAVRQCFWWSLLFSHPSPPRYLQHRLHPPH